MSYALVPGRNLVYLKLLDYMKCHSINNIFTIDRNIVISSTGLLHAQLTSAIQYLKANSYIRLATRGSNHVQTVCELLPKAFGSSNLDSDNKLLPKDQLLIDIYKFVEEKIKSGKSYISVGDIARSIKVTDSIIANRLKILINDGKIIKVSEGSYRGPACWALPYISPLHIDVAKKVYDEDTGIDVHIGSYGVGRKHCSIDLPVVILDVFSKDEVKEMIKQTIKDMLITARNKYNTAASLIEMFT